MQVPLTMLAACALAFPTYAQTVVQYGSGSIASSVPSIMNDNDAYYAPTPANMESFYSTLNIDPSLKNKAIPTNKWWTWLATGYNKDGNGNWSQGSVYGSQLWAYPGMVVPETYGMDVYFPNSWQARTNPNSPDGYFDTNAGIQIFGNVTPSVGAGDVLIADFDGTTYPSGWTTTGSAFGSGPVQGATWPGESPAVTGYIGNACVNTYTGSDATTGTLTSPTFTVNDNYIDLLVSGGNTTATEVELIVGGNIVDRVSGQNSNTMAWTQWNVTAYKGQSAQIKLVDSSTGSWGHIAASWIVETNTSTNPPTQYTSTFKASGNPIVTGYGDWTLDYKETDGNGNEIDTTLARGVPFVWARYTGVKPTINWLPNNYTLYDSAGNVIDTGSGSFTASSFAFDDNGRTYAVFAPTNTTFKIIGSGIQAQLSSPSFLVYGFLPDHTYLNTFSNYAYVRPTGSSFAWTYDIPNGLVKTTWTLTTSALQGTATSTLQGWLPHHYRTTSNNLTLQPYTYLTPRGTMKVAPGNSWQINFPFRGITPVLPAPHQNGLANDFNLSRLTGLVNNFAPYHPGAFDETYGGGKELAISAQYMTMADQLGMPGQANNIKNTMETRFADWLSYTSGKPQHFFARYPDWGALVGYGASYGTQGFNDNHFHYGYWTLSAALLGMEDHTWLANYSPMMTQILKEYANWDRADTSYPFMRTFDVWEGHSWAGGTSSPNGENQESSSEAMNSWVGMFMLGSMTNNSTVQAAGAMGYAIESSAVNEYWQDMYQTNFPSSYGMGMNGVLGSGGLAYGTFFTADPAWIYGIQMVPSNHWNNYLARNKTFAANQLSKMWTERASGVNGFTYTGTNDPSGLGGYLGNYILGFELLFDPDTVASTLDTYAANNDPVATDGTYAGEIYYQTHALRGLGDQDLNYWTSIPTSQVYLNSHTGVRTAVIYNPSSTGQTATIYNNGTAVMSITVPAYQLVSQIVASTSVAPSTPTELNAMAGKARVNLYWAPSSGSTTYNVYMGTTAGGESATPVLTNISRASCVVTGLTNGTKYYFKVAGVNGVGTSPLSTEVNATPTAPATGPYGGTAWAVPGTVEAENFDTGGQGVGYNDSDAANNGGKYRTSEGVDIENATDTSGTYDVGYTVSGEWMNYTVNAANPGQYTVSFRVACPVNGCAIHLQDADGNSLTGTVTIPNTGGFQAWANVTATMILPAGQQTLTLVEDTGGFNINFMTFTFTGTLGPPVPTGVTATPGNAAVTLAWTASSGATSYNVYRGTTAGGESPTAIATGVTATTYKNTGVTNGTTYYYEVTAVNGGGESAKSAEVSAAPSTPHATFVKIDSTTKGNWRDFYGVEGYNVIGDSSTNNPHYKTGIAVTPGAHNTGLWAGSSLSPSCLQTTTSGNPQRIAGIWYQTSWTLNVNAVGSHNIELYLLDFPNAGYAETITIKDATTGAVLDTRSASNFAGGAYYVWTVNGNVNITFTSTAGHWAVLSGIFFGGATGNKSPTQPTGLTATPAGSGVNLSWTASTGAVSYNIYRGTTAGGESTTPVATGIKTTSYSNGGLSPNTTYYYKVVAVNTYAGSFASAETSATTLTPTSTVAFVKTDTTTKGTWKGVYGVDGYNVIGDTSGTNPLYPSYATVTPSTHTSGVWASTTALTSCLQKIATGSTDRMAGVWYNTTWSLNVNVTGSHQLALYFLDYPNAGYAETVTIKDAGTGFVLDTRSVSAFTGGVYDVWTVSGNVTVTLTSTAGHWAVLSGVFFK